jgi:hypothetical protein
MNSTEIVIAALENNPSIIVPLVREFPPALLKRRPAPREWSAHEIACHVADVAPLFSARLDLMLRADNPVIKAHSPDAEEGALLKVDLDEALDRFVTDRRLLVERLRSLTPEQWQRTGQHAQFARYSVFIMFRHMALHDMTHAYSIEQLLFKMDWA